MIFGFAINDVNSSKFGVVDAASEEAAKDKVTLEAGVFRGAVKIISAEEALSQFDEIAFLTPAES